LKLEAKIESSIIQNSFERLVPGGFKVGFIGSNWTALPGPTGGRPTRLVRNDCADRPDPPSPPPEPPSPPSDPLDPPAPPLDTPSPPSLRGRNDGAALPLRPPSPSAIVDRTPPPESETRLKLCASGEDTHLVGGSMTTSTRIGMGACLHSGRCPLVQCLGFKV